MKKLICMFVALVMMVSTVTLFSGCDDAGKNVDDGNLSLSVYGYSGDSSPEKQDVFQRYQEKWAKKAKEISDADIEWVGGDISMIMASGDYPDIILKTVFQNVDVAKYANQGILVDLSQYINETDTPNIWAMFTDNPTTKAIATSPDGGIYALPWYNGDPGSYIETYWYINDSWLQKLNLETPTNLDELYEVLKAFKANDCNGNGDPNDEIPMTFMNAAAYSYPETLLSCWGVSTKFGMYDSYLNVQNGKVNFTPVMDEWKEMLKFYAKLYSEGLLDQQCFTYDSAQWSSTMKADEAIVGVAFGKENPFGQNGEQYKVMLPLKSSADSTIEPVFHVHPGVIGTRNAVHITSACENPVAAIKWIDTFYDQEATIQNWYGEAGDGSKDTFTYDENATDGKYRWKDPAENGYSSISEMCGYNTTCGPHMPGYWESQKQRGVLVQDCEYFSQFDELYNMYKPYLDKETWPRPYYDPEESNTLANLQTDIFNTVEKFKADCIMGRSDIDAGWDNYIKELEKLNVDKLIEINQNAYNVYQDVLENIDTK